MAGGATPPSSPIEWSEYWIVRLASGSMSAEEMARFEAWLSADATNRAAFESARALWRSLEDRGGKVVALRRRQFRPLVRSPAAWAGAVAACLAVAVVGPQVAPRLLATDATSAGEVRALALPDGTRAMLDTGSAVAVRYDGGQRRVDLLRGRIWVQVEHDDPRPFRVATANGVVEDIGTAFEVARDGRAAEVAVTEGAVRVETKDNRHGLVLHRRQRARYGADGDIRRLGDADEEVIAVWRRGYIVVEDAPLGDAVRSVARYRSAPVWVQPGQAASTPVSGIFLTEAPDDALKVLADVAGLRLIRLPGGTIILAK
ncbi:FecR family protein [Caulobacter endophyticus]|uniref:Iron dicitrate transport regulator FecR n=1 Tax=Caulobacter endophyticus TaxID=2172652 RepID=A0A2T9JGS9_9CAUL|nr:FecR domain-containing protein [Caulobacter endophyticus]PVM82910.1 iron dicitrate transport regulator FecR [Caulobacter endophyticus]